MLSEKFKHILTLLAVLLLVVFNYPFLSVANKSGAKYPSLYFYIFIVWGLAIVISYIIIRLIKQGRND